MIEFSIPDFYLYAPLVISLIKLMTEHPEKFNEDVKIGSCYGCFPCSWNGGRVQKSNGFTKEDVKIATRFFNENGITIRYTFTNRLLEESDMDDTCGNLILNTTKENQLIKNDVNIGTKVLEEYIKNYFPEFNIIYSTTLCITDIEQINKMTEKNLLVLDYTFNNDFEKLKQLKHPENIEILLNEACHDDCPVRKKHYLHHSKLNLKIEEEPGDITSCIFNEEKDNYYDIVTTKKRYISIENIRKNYLPLGFNKFKIVGRNTSVQFCTEAFCSYLVKPEFQNEIRYELLKKFFNNL